jgi:hypothetical protein
MVNVLFWNSRNAVIAITKELYSQHLMFLSRTAVIYATFVVNFTNNPSSSKDKLVIIQDYRILAQTKCKGWSYLPECSWQSAMKV